MNVATNFDYLKNFKNKKILICPLDWGLGHAARLVPIIKELNKKNTVIIGADNAPLELLKQEFPKLSFVKLHSLKIKYSNTNSMSIAMLSQSNKILKSIEKEQIEVNEIVEEKNIDIIISDNRYGVWNKNTYNIFITHQLMLKTPRFFRFIENSLHTKILKYVKNFDECWVPDVEGENNYTGDLSHKYPLLENTKFIGILSRFEKTKNKNEKIKFCVILSGPEPQRSILEEKISEQLINSKYKSVIVRGLFDEKKQIVQKNNLTVMTYLTSNELSELMQMSEIVICRAGYSSIMDLIKLEKKAILIPTPGQTEQEYLAKHLDANNQFVFQSQNKLDIEKVIKEKLNYGFI